MPVPIVVTNHPKALPPPQPLGMRIGFWACIVVGVAVVVRRLVALRQSGADAATAPPQVAALDAWFRNHVSLTYAHILVALVFVCLLPLVFWSRTRQSASVHVAFYGLGGLVVLTAYGMTGYSVGGWVERSAVLFFNTAFLVSLAMSLRAYRAGDQAAERQWTLRATAIVLGIATTRPVMGVFFATSRLTHWTPQQFFGPAFWIGFSINTLVMEIWLSRNARIIPAERDRVN